MHSEIKPDQPIAFHSIGIIRTPFPEAPGTPIQGVYARGSEGRVVLSESFAPALDDIEGFERLWLVYWMDRIGPYKPKVIPYRDTKEHGLFATRSPSRPNAIGMSVVRFLKREGCVLFVADVDMLDNTPLLDIKPYVPEFDAHPQSRAGWFDNPGVDRRQSDNRFHRSED
jgi:tRNA-Thr(GGU) m(6)t(6)A37 methyltransferase TsaA